jgi:hypothetical protein
LSLKIEGPVGEQVPAASKRQSALPNGRHNGARRRLRLHEKGGKEHGMAVHHLLEQILDEYIVAAGLQSGRRSVPVLVERLNLLA